MSPFYYIIVVCYNAGEKLNKTLNSVRMQTFNNFRVIIKDGGSTDDSISKIVKEFGIDEQTGFSDDGRYQLVAEKDNGIYDAMNGALNLLLQEISHEDRNRMEPGPFVYFLNCGDYLMDENVLQNVYDWIIRESHLTFEANTGSGVNSSKAASQNQADPKDRVIQDNHQKTTAADPDLHRHIYYGDIYERVTGQRVASNPHMDDFACYRNVPCHQACFYDLELMLLEHFDTTWQVRADYEHFLRCRYLDKARTHYIPYVIADYEGGGYSETQEAGVVSERERRQIISRYLPASKVRKYDLLRILTLAPIRTKIAQNPRTAQWYNALKSSLYHTGK